MSSLTSNVTVRLDCEMPYDIPHAVNVLSAHAVPGLEVIQADRATVQRLLPTGDGHHVPAMIRFAEDGIYLTTERNSVCDPALVRTTRQWLDLDAAPRVIARALDTDPLLGPLVAARPGIRIIGYPDGFEGAVMTVIGQQVSLAAARTFGSRLVAGFGTPHGDLHAFPTPQALAMAKPEQLQSAIGLTGSRSRTLQALAEMCADGLLIHPDSDHALVRAALATLPGVGPWTIEYLALRALKDSDACPTGDLVLRRALRMITPAAVRRMATTWQPWRAYAVSHLWAVALGTHAPTTNELVRDSG